MVVTVGGVHCLGVCGKSCIVCCSDNHGNVREILVNFIIYWLRG